MNDPLPSQSTYYFLRKRIVEHQERIGEDLMGAMFKSVTRKQIKELEAVGISTESASAADTDFAAPVIEADKEVICQTLSRASLDGGYHTPDNDERCKGIDMIYSSLQGAPSRYDLEMTQEGLLITDAQTGIHQIAQIAKKTKSSKASTWRIRLEKGWRYFNEQAIRASAMRRRLRNRTQKELNKRNNVESTIFHFCCSLRNNKSKYRGIQKQRLWSRCRCLWINIVRIANFVAEPCQRTPEIA